MIIDIINKLIKPTILIACVSLTITWAFNIQNLLITETQVNGITMKVLNFRIYLTNIQNAWSTIALDFETIIPNRTWTEIESNIFQGQFWQAIGNNIAFVFDWIYFPLNFLLYLTRWVAWILKLGLAIIGWNITPSAYDPITGEPTAYYSQLAHILAWVTTNLYVPYI